MPQRRMGVIRLFVLKNDRTDYALNDEDHWVCVDDSRLGFAPATGSSAFDCSASDMGLTRNSAVRSRVAVVEFPQ